MKYIISALILTLMSSCAAGAATAGYALKAQAADSLTAGAERSLIDKIKQEIAQENRNGKD